MSDVVVTVPMNFTHPNAPGERGLRAWLAEGDAPGQPESGARWDFTTVDSKPPEIARGERVYITCEGCIVGYSPLVDLQFEKGPWGKCKIHLIRAGGAVACSIPERVTGFRGWKYRWWDRAIERPIDLSGFIGPRQPIRWGGTIVCPRRCGDCIGELHHWMEHVPDVIAEGDDPAAIQRLIDDDLSVVWGCKHCDAWVEMAIKPSGADLDPHTAFQLAIEGKTVVDKLAKRTEPPKPKAAEATGFLFVK